MPKWQDRGNGDPCPDDPEHGNMFVLHTHDGRPAKQFCSHIDHAREGTNAIFPLWGVVDPKQAPVARRKRGAK